MIIVSCIAIYLFIGWCIALTNDLKDTKVPSWQTTLTTIVFWLPGATFILVYILTLSLTMRKYG